MRNAVGDRPLAIVATTAGLPRDAIRSVLNGHDPRLSRAVELTDVLGLEFYVGPPRADVPRAITEALGLPENATLARAVEVIRAHSDPKAEVLLAASEALNQAAKQATEVADKIVRGAFRDLFMDPNAVARAPVAPVVEFPETRQLDQIDSSVGAVNGSPEEYETGRERLTFRRDWLNRFGLDPRQCAVLSVEGHSMEPTLPQGATILVDLSRRGIRVGGIFVVRTAQGVLVRSAGKDKAGNWQLLSDHPACNPVPWPHDAEVLGEVKWMARNL